MSRWKDITIGEVTLQATEPGDTYLDDFDAVWIGDVWDLARRGTTYELYRKGNFVTFTNSEAAALNFLADRVWLGVTDE